MDVVQVTPRMLDTIPAGSGARTCPACGNAVRVGQWVLRDRLRAAAFADTLRLVHINPCLREHVEATPAVDDAPPTTGAAALDQHRRDHEAAMASA